MSQTDCFKQKQNVCLVHDNHFPQERNIHVVTISSWIRRATEFSQPIVIYLKSIFILTYFFLFTTPNFRLVHEQQVGLSISTPLPMFYAIITFTSPNTCSATSLLPDGNQVTGDNIQMGMIKYKMISLRRWTVTCLYLRWTKDYTCHKYCGSVAWHQGWKENNIPQKLPRG